MRSLLLVAVAACGHEPAPAPVTSPPPAASANVAPSPDAAVPVDAPALATWPAECQGHGGIRYDAPTADDRKAGRVGLLTGSFEGEGMGEEAEWTCLISAEKIEVVHHKFRVEIRASTTELQRITVGTDILVRIPPKGELSVDYHPCANWNLEAIWFDDGATIDGKDTRAVRRNEDCPKGYVDGGDIHQAGVPQCKDSSSIDCPYRRCVKAAVLESMAKLAISYDGSEDQPEPLGTSRAIEPYHGFCPRFQTLSSDHETVSIAPGYGERWTLTVDDKGRIGGTVKLTR